MFWRRYDSDHPRVSGDVGLAGVAISGYGMKEDVVKSREAGFLAHLTKPVNLQQVQTMLRQFADRMIRKEAENLSQ